MEHENRYAILLGINDYEKDPLIGCVNDVNDIKHELINKCNFNEENIYALTSNSDSPLIDPYGTLVKTIYDLKKKVSQEGHENNFFFFSFSGHALRSDNVPALQLKGISVPLEDIYTLIMSPPLTNNSFFLFDCCQIEHDGLIRTRGSSYEDEEFLNQLISGSEGTAILYACKKDQTAGEKGRNGFLTKAWIDTIKNEKNYDEYGILSSEILISKVKRDFVKIENQDPIGEYRGSGYYPISSLKFWKEEGEEVTIKRTGDIKVTESEEPAFSLAEKGVLDIDKPNRIS